MNPHPDLHELIAFAGRRLPPAAAWHVDGHLRTCAECRERLTTASNSQHDLVALAGVVQAGAHLSFEQMQAYVDERLPSTQRTAAEAHTALCTMCRLELADLARHAPTLRQVTAPTGAPRRRTWFALVPALAAAAFIGTVAITVVLEDRGAGASHESMRPASDIAAAPAGLNHQSLEGLASVSGPAAAAWHRRDFARLAALLQPLAQNDQPQALAALASLYAQGFGVPRDMRMAEQLWQRAADLGQPHAEDNLKILRLSAASR